MRINLVFLSFFIVLLSSCKPMIAKRSHKKMLAKYASVDDGSRFTLINGTRIHYRVSGQGPVLLMIPGTLDTIHTYDAITPYLEDHFTLVKLDVPGFGFSDSLESTSDDFLENLNEVINLFMLSLGYENYHIVGNSLGGLLAWNHALSFPENTKKIFLLDPAAYRQGTPWFLDVSNPAINTFATLFSGILPISTALKLLSKIDKGIVGETDNKEYIEKQIERISDIFQTKKNIPSYIGFLELYTTYKFHQSDNIPNLKVNDVFLVFGEFDSVVPVKEQLPNWERDLPSIQKMIIPNGGHLPHWEQPELVSKKIIEFLK